MKEIPMRDFDFIVSPAKLLTPEIVQMVSSIYEHKGKQELFLEANVDELKTLLEVALIPSTGASNRIEGIFTSDKRLEELVIQKAEPRNRSEQEIAGYREVLSTTEIIELCPDISKITVERTLTNLVKSGYIAKVGAGPSTGYVRV